MRSIKFRFWSPQGKAFVQQYKYNGLVDELFDEREWSILVPSQYTGMKDCEGKEVWEGDIIKFERRLTNKDTKEYIGYIDNMDTCYIALTKAQDSEGTLAHFWLHELCKQIFRWKIKVIGNKFEHPELIPRKY